ncbi:MAG: hypothetical protein U0232_27565 [Thermomicrobiales bacterium]
MRRRAGKVERAAEVGDEGVGWVAGEARPEGGLLIAEARASRSTDQMLAAGPRRSARRG